METQSRSGHSLPLVLFEGVGADEDMTFDAGAVVDKQMFYILAAENSSSLVSEMMLLAGPSTDTAEKTNAE